MTTPRSFEVIRKEMLQTLATYYSLLAITSIYGSLLADSGELPKAKEKIQAFLGDPDSIDQLKGDFSEMGLSEEELQMLLEERLPRRMYMIHEELEEIGEGKNDGDGDDLLSPAERGVSRLLLNTDFAQ